MTGAPGIDAFSLTNCGPVDRALARVGLASGESPRLLLRALLPALVIWVPLLLSALARPRADSDGVITFFEDLSTHVRFLVVVPLLVLAEAGIGRRARLVAAQFVHAGLVAEVELPRFGRLLRKARAAFDSALAEIVIAALAAYFVWSSMRGFTTDHVMFWFEEAAPGGGARLSAAGWWYAVGSWVPGFLFLRWIWRYLAWSWLLLRVSRLDLQLVATHPDRAAGLLFVSFGHAAFAQLGLAASCLVAAAIGTKVLHEGAVLASFQWPVTVFAAFAVLVGIAPLFVFQRPLRVAKETGYMQYGAFSSHFVQAFHRKWIDSKAGERPLDAADDIGPLADIGGGFERVFTLRLVPLTLNCTLAFAVAAAAPMLLLLLTVMPLREVVRLLMQAMI